MLGEGEIGAGLQHSVRLAEEAPSVRDIHSDVLRVRSVEGSVRVWQLLPVSLVYGDPILQVEERGKSPACFNKRWRNVDAGDPAAETRREVARRSTEAATDVENMMAGVDGQAVGKIDRGGTTPR